MEGKTTQVGGSLLANVIRFSFRRQANLRPGDTQFLVLACESLVDLDAHKQVLLGIYVIFNIQEEEQKEKSQPASLPCTSLPWSASTHFRAEGCPMREETRHKSIEHGR